MQVQVQVQVQMGRPYGTPCRIRHLLGAHVIRHGLLGGATGPYGTPCGLLACSATIVALWHQAGAPEGRTLPSAQRGEERLQATNITKGEGGGHEMDGMKEPRASNVHCTTVMSEFLR